MKLSGHVETVVTLRGVKVDGHVSIDLDVEKLNNAQTKLTKWYYGERYAD